MHPSALFFARLKETKGSLRREPLRIIMLKNGSSGTSTPTARYISLFRRWTNVQFVTVTTSDDQWSPLHSIIMHGGDRCCGRSKPLPYRDFCASRCGCTWATSRLSLLPRRRCRGTRRMRFFELYLIYFYLIRLDLRIKARSIHLLHGRRLWRDVAARLSADGTMI